MFFQITRASCRGSILLVLATLLLVNGFRPSILPSSTKRANSSRPKFGLFSTLSPTSSRTIVQENEDDDKHKKKVIKIAPRVVSSTVNSDGVGPLSMSLDELANQLGGRGRARLVWDCYKIGIDPAHFHANVIKLGPYDDFETIHSLLPSSRRSQRLGMETLQTLSNLWRGKNCVEGGVAHLVTVSQARDETTKLLLRLADGLLVETVIIPWNGIRSTLCVSSQVGCRQACRFCATGKLGLHRSLTSDEILAQVFWALKLCRWYDLPTLTNVVFMGMGEPADNAMAVIKAAEILTTNELFQLSASKVTVSTVAPTPQSFGLFASAPCALAWSVHAARDEVRKQLVPTTQYSMKELRQGMIDTLLQRPLNFRTTMWEVVLIDQVNNDIEKDGAALVELCREFVDAVPGSKLVVNLIPYNDIYARDMKNSLAQHSYRAPPMSSVIAFQKYLREEGVYTHVRATRGDDESAACGQLATQRLNKDSGSNNFAA